MIDWGNSHYIDVYDVGTLYANDVTVVKCSYALYAKESGGGPQVQRPTTLLTTTVLPVGICLSQVGIESWIIQINGMLDVTTYVLYMYKWGLSQIDTCI